MALTPQDVERSSIASQTVEKGSGLEREGSDQTATGVPLRTERSHEKGRTPSPGISAAHGAWYKTHEDGTKIITFAGEDDKDNPRNWSRGKKWYLTLLCSWLNILVASQASAYSTGQKQIQQEFGISNELSIAGLSLYVLGFAVGPMVVAPLSETFGRRRIYIWCWALFVLLQFGVAFAPNAPVIFVFRFLTGFFSSPPLANTGGVISDLFARDESGVPMSVYVFGSCIGPPFGNVYAGFIAQQLGWRWTHYLTSLLIMGVHWFLIVFTLTETRHNIILARKAHAIRKSTGDESYVSTHGDERKPIFTLIKTSLARPILFLFTEPITAFGSIWNGLLYGLIFLFNDAFTIVFGPGDGYNIQHSGLVELTFVAFIIGEALGLALYPWTQERFYQRAIKKAGQSVPEARMAGGTIGCCLLPVGLFIFAWTCYPSISPVVPLIGAAVFGLGFFFVLFGILSWTVDSYREYSASALGAVVLVRNIFGAALPLAGAPMYEK
ncbi:MFS general substrate transporter [Ceraceosorus guamensis]|uniref:MFS general substrate transporter n=1 Tax=Ceraceosorus guamensis TaxID=1522189 RepID=A0A316W004_9BASI|nr:MFS general substrate transporter [Ceraceosorus guamensis]PWN43247.1 MFS general substrate transporter [Ceraceosorus guamensis]